MKISTELAQVLGTKVCLTIDDCGRYESRVYMTASNPAMSRKLHRSKGDLGSVVREIDESIADNSQQLRDDVSRYFESHRQELIQELLREGKATIKTFAGDFSFSIADLSDAINRLK